MKTSRCSFLQKILTLIVVAMVLMPARVNTQPTIPTRESLNQNQAAPSKDGARNPASIPDFIAYEFFFRSLITSPAEGKKGQRRVETFSRQPGLDDAQANALVTEAQNIYKRMGSFDKKIKAIKDRTWPDPSAQVLLQLKDIQRAKEAAILEESQALLGRRHANTSSKLSEFISSYVKQRIKGYPSIAMVPEESPHRHHAAGKTTARPAFVPVVQMDETVYIYSNTVYNAPDTWVCSYADVQATGGSYGHEYSPKIDFYGPSGQYISTEGSFTSLDLCEGEDCDDGVFIAIVTAIVFCPIMNGTFNNGNGDSSASVPAFIRVNAYGAFSPNPITSGATGPTSNISLSITASRSASTTVTIEPSYIVVSGSAPISIGANVQGGGSFSITGGTTVSKTTGYFATLITTNPTRVRAEAAVSANNAGVINSNPQSASILTINK